MNIALVTGGSRGIGRAISIKLAQMGYYILINYKSNKSEAENTLKYIRDAGANGELMPFDVANFNDTKAALDSWQNNNKEEYISVIVNNAGIRKDNLMIWMEHQEWANVISTNLDSFYNIVNPLLKAMLTKKFGRIINIVSLSGLKGLPGQTNYSAAKGGIIAATKALSQEVARKGITVNAVAPGFVSTDMTEGLDEKELKKMIPVGRFGNPEEVADLVAFLVSKNASYITGETISINGGLY